MKTGRRAFLVGERQKGDRKTGAGPQAHGHNVEFGSRDLNGFYRCTDT